jgi:hypothetical protein
MDGCCNSSIAPTMLTKWIVYLQMGLPHQWLDPTTHVIIITIHGFFIRCFNKTIQNNKRQKGHVVKLDLIVLINKVINYLSSRQWNI